MAFLLIQCSVFLVEQEGALLVLFLTNLRRLEFAGGWLRLRQMLSFDFSIANSYAQFSNWCADVELGGTLLFVCS